jgi:hypothetical protein
MEEKRSLSIPTTPGVLWQHGGMTCTCRTHREDWIEIHLVVAGVVVERKFFADQEAAAGYAIEKMQAYDGAPGTIRSRKGMS